LRPKGGAEIRETWVFEGPTAQMGVRMGSRFGPVSGPKRGGSQRRSVLGLLFGSESGPVAGPVLGHFWILSLAGSGGGPPASGRPGGPAAGPGKKAARAEGWRRTAPRPQHSAPRCTAPRPRCTAPRRAARRCTAVACAPLRLNRCLRATALEQGGAGAVPLASRRSASALDARQECAGSVARGGGRAETVQARSNYCKRLRPCRPYRAVFGDPAAPRPVRAAPRRDALRGVVPRLPARHCA